MKKVAKKANTEREAWPHERAKKRRKASKAVEEIDELFATAKDAKGREKVSLVSRGLSREHEWKYLRAESPLHRLRK